MQTEIQQQRNSEKTKLNEEETNEPVKSTSDSGESHIKEIKKINEMGEHFTAVVQINGIKKEFIIDTGSPTSNKATRRKNYEIHRNTENKPIPRRKQK